MTGVPPNTNTPGGSGAGTGQTRVYGQETVDDVQDRINDILRPLTQAHVDVNQFTIANINNLGYNSEQFCKLARAVCQFDDRDTLFDVLAIGISNGFYNMPMSMTIASFCRFCEFLKTKQGRDALNRVQKGRKLKRKAVHGQTPEQVAVVAMFNVQFSDYKQARKKSVSEIDERMAELRREIRRLEAQKIHVEAQLAADYIPSSQYVSPTQAQLNTECYDLYEQDAVAKKLQVLGRTDTGFVTAVEMYGDRVQEQHKLEFCNQEGNIEKLTKYFHDRIQYLEPRGDTKLADNFRNYLAAAGQQLPPPFSFEPETAGNPTSPNRDPTPPRGTDPQQTTGGGRRTRAPRTRVDDRGKAPTTTRTRVSTRSTRQQAPPTHNTDQSAEEVDSEESASHSSRPQ